MKSHILTLLAIILTSTTACSPIVKSERVDESQTNMIVTSKGDGIRVYYLPAATFHISLKEYTAPTPGQQSAQLLAAQDTKTDAATTPADVTSTTKPINITTQFFEINKTKYQFTIDYSYTKDRNSKYILHYDTSAIADDEIQTTGKSELLSSVTASSQDRTSDILKKVAELAQFGYSFGTGTVPKPQSDQKLLSLTTAGETDIKLPIYNVDIDITPEDIISNTSFGLGDLIASRTKNKTASKQNDNAPEKINGDKTPKQQENSTPKSDDEKKPYDTLNKITIYLNYNNTNTPGNYDKNKSFTDYTNNEPYNVTKGILFRTKKEYELTIEIAGEVEKSPKYCIIQKPVWLPDKSLTFAYDLKRGALVTKTYDLKFEQGFLTSDKVVKPSEILAGLSLPASIINSLTSFITNVFQLRVNYDSKAAAYEAAKKDFDNTKAFVDAVTQMQVNQIQTLLAAIKQNSPQK